MGEIKQKKITKRRLNKNKNNVKYLVFDIETYPDKHNYHVPYLLVMISDKETKVWFKKDKTHNIIRDFIDHVKKNYHGYTMFAHNLKDFDGRFLLDELKADEFQSSKKTCLFRDQHIMSINLKNNITIKDSVLLLPDSLAELANNFKLPINKGELPHHLINEENYKSYEKQAIDYCILDCEVLFKVLREFELLSNKLSPVNPLSCLTLPQFAYHTFLSDNFFPEDWNIYRLDKEKYNFVSSGYYGGRVDVFITYLEYMEDLISYFDVNSLYPYSMTKEMPDGPGDWTTIAASDLNHFFGFVEVTVIAPQNLHIPILPYRWEGSLYFPKGEFRGVHFSEELKYALSKGYKIKEVHKALKFGKKTDVFKKYVDTFYKKKQEESYTKGGLYYIIKLLLNGLYGRFGMKHENTEYIISSPEEVTQYYKYYTVHTEIALKNASLLKLSKEPPLISAHIKDFLKQKEINAPKVPSFNREDRSPAHVSAAIAAYSRIILDTYIRIIGEENVAYVDTDSIISKKSLPEEHIDPNELGKWKLEGMFNLFYCFGPKAYTLESLRGPKYTVDRCKGISKDELKKAIKALKEKATYTSIETTNFKKDLKSMKIFTNVELKKTITAYTTKKRKFVDNDVRTYPLNAPNDFKNL